MGDGTVAGVSSSPAAESPLDCPARRLFAELPVCDGPASVTPNMVVYGIKPLEAGRQAQRLEVEGRDEGIESIQTLDAGMSLTWQSSLPKSLAGLAEAAFQVLPGWRLPLSWLNRTPHP